MTTINQPVIDLFGAIPDFGAPGGMPKPLALWPYAPVHLDGDEATLTMLAKKTGIIPARLASFRVARNAEKLARVQAATGARYWIPVGAWSDVYEEVARRGIKSFFYDGRTYTFACGDPRAWLESHSVYLGRLRAELSTALGGIGILPVTFHIDYECWNSAVHTDLPDALKRFVHTKCWLLHDVIRSAFPAAPQIWNEKFGLRDIGASGRIHSVGYFGMEGDMPGDFAQSAMFSPDQPYWWEELLCAMNDYAPSPDSGEGRGEVAFVWNISLGLAARPSASLASPAPLRLNYSWQNGNGGGYSQEYSRLLGEVLSGRKAGDRWQPAKRITLVEIECPIFNPDPDTYLRSRAEPPMAEHVDAFLDGFCGVRGEQSSALPPTPIATPETT